MGIISIVSNYHWGFTGLRIRPPSTEVFPNLRIGISYRCRAENQKTRKIKINPDLKNIGNETQGSPGLSILIGLFYEPLRHQTH